MTAFRRLPRGEWEAQLRAHGCLPLDGKGALNTAEWWRWPWPPHIPFTVAVDEEGYADPWAFQRILADMAKLAPPDWQFPEE